MKRVAGVTAGVVFFALAGAGVFHATPQLFASAKKAGMPATNCQYCHTVAMPKKANFKPDELNERGKFLMEDMKNRNLKTPDVEKLKEFKGGK